ncbi:hemolysin-type calcium-binding repeat-containing protein [Nitrosomonas sp. PY1]|uniref:hemolysin expression modulating protein n=1 Tax=Nitrosomonas sp. PY1 TaxID=1803906 RepID=UPI001FC86826|nr:hemolysin expression modulating protein [Nitrosomonas sp. PY1]GKS70042.1 hemolysin-type calcium-binding repeat-containing protein [Nitrosomonas sp. PY1]
MAITQVQRPNLSSGSIKYIEGIPFEGLGSAGFTANDLLITGDEFENFLEGGSGNDELVGGGGNDTLKEGLGNGIIKGDDGDDDLDGGEGTEKLYGGSGNDTLRAGYGYDRLTGGDGNDTFDFYALGHFGISDFTIGQDWLSFHIEGIDQLSDLVPYITGISGTTSDGAGTRFDFGSAASIELVGVKFEDITADMIVFNI